MFEDDAERYYFTTAAFDINLYEQNYNKLRSRTFVISFIYKGLTKQTNKQK